jgi:SNF2 family DNA or RNA helicase
MVENQAIGRVLRIGQGRDVKVVRYLVKGTIEEVISRGEETMTILADNPIIGHTIATMEKAGLCEDGME